MRDIAKMITDENLTEVVSKSKYYSQLEAIVKMLKGENVFLSGPAGSGKSYTINKFVDIKKSILPDTVISKTSTTGISAVNIGGRTIHSFIGLSPMSVSAESTWLSKAKYQDVYETDILIIDEVSMLSEWHLKFIKEMIDKVQAKKRKKMQIIVSGDFTQLPPVNSSSELPEKGRFCYNSTEWQQLNFQDVYLDRVYRAVDVKLKNMLESISLGENDASHLDDITTISSNRVLTSPYPVLLTKNKEVEKVNTMKQNLNRSNKVLVSNLEFITYFNNEENIKFARESGMQSTVKLKENDTVMITKNEINQGTFGIPSSIDAPVLTNGMIGTVKNIKEGKEISFDFHFQDPDSKRLYVYKILNKAEFYKTREVKSVSQVEDENGTVKEVVTVREEIIAGFKQVPVKLAYAISVHKSQGQTFSHVICDLSDCWIENLGYVMLSRAQSYNGIRIIEPDNFKSKLSPKALKVSHESLVIKRTVLNNSFIGTKEKRLKELKEDLDIFNNLRY